MMNEIENDITPGGMRGYILIETLLAILIVSVGLLLAARYLIVPLQATTSLENRANASAIARTRLDEIVLGVVPVAAGMGHEVRNETTYTWVTETETVEDKLARVSVSVSWQEHSSEKTLTDSTYVYVPPQD